MSDVNWLVGRLRSISFDRVTEADSLDLTSTVGALAWTVISSDSAAWVMTRSTERLTVVVRRMFSWTTDLKPCRTHFTEYSPGGRAGNRNAPWASLTVLRAPMRFRPISMTATPGSGFFCSSMTLPRIAPVSRDCGNDRTAMVRSKPIASNDFALK